MSSMFFNDVEAVKIAVNMERSGLDFYTQAARRARDPLVRKVFDDLAADERDHLASFQELEERLLAEPRGQSYLDGEEVNEYMRRLVESHVFAADGAVAGLLDQADTDLAALGVGIRAERDTILFYQEMIDFTDSGAAREAFNRIIEEERKHLVALADRSERCEGLHG